LSTRKVGEFRRQASGVRRQSHERMNNEYWGTPKCSRSRYPPFANCAKDGAPTSEVTQAGYFLSADFEEESVFGLLSFLPESLLDSLLPSESDFDSDLEAPDGFFA